MGTRSHIGSSSPIYATSTVLVVIRLIAIVTEGLARRLGGLSLASKQFCATSKSSHESFERRHLLYGADVSKLLAGGWVAWLSNCSWCRTLTTTSCCAWNPRPPLRRFALPFFGSPSRSTPMQADPRRSSDKWTLLTRYSVIRCDARPTTAMAVSTRTRARLKVPHPGGVSQILAQAGSPERRRTPLGARRVKGRTSRRRAIVKVHRNLLPPLLLRLGVNLRLRRRRRAKKIPSSARWMRTSSEILYWGAWQKAHRALCWSQASSFSLSAAISASRHPGWCW